MVLPVSHLTTSTMDSSVQKVFPTLFSFVLIIFLQKIENKNKHFPDIVCWQKPSYHFCMCLFYFLEICKSQWLISSSSCLPSFHSFWMPCRTILRSFRLQWNEFWVRESSTSSASSDSMQNKSHKQLLPTVDPARGGAPSNLYFSHDFTVEYICKIVLLHNHYNHNSLCMYMLIYS